VTSILEKLTGQALLCSTCITKVTFVKIEDVECDYGIHTLVQCPNCEELFSIDGPCNAFQNLLELADYNSGILTNHEIDYYRLSVHSCNLE